jgi:hypothetical protein
MSIAASALSELPLGAHLVPATSTGNTPKNRLTTAKADVVERPEPR